MSRFAGVLQSDGASGGAFTLLAVATLIGPPLETVGARFKALWDLFMVFVGLNLVLVWSYPSWMVGSRRRFCWA